MIIYQSPLKFYQISILVFWQSLNLTMTLFLSPCVHIFLFSSLQSIRMWILNKLRSNFNNSFCSNASAHICCFSIQRNEQKKIYEQKNKLNSWSKMDYFIGCLEKSHIFFLIFFLSFLLLHFHAIFFFSFGYTIET